MKRRSAFGILLILIRLITSRNVFRELQAECSDYSLSQGSEGSSFPNCSIQAGECQNYIPSTLSSYAFDQAAEYKYCQNLPEFGSINLADQSNREIKLGKGTGASVGNHDVGEWKIKTKNTHKVNIDALYDPMVHEDMMIEVNSTSGILTYNSKDLFKGGKSSFHLEFESVSWVGVKVKILSDTSSYTITIRQEKVKEESGMSVLFIIVMVGGLIGMAIPITFVAGYVGYNKYADNKPKKPILDTNNLLRSIPKGKFKDMDVKFGQNSCSIGLNEYDPLSKTRMLRGGNHLFHSKCFEEWLNSSKQTRLPKCPNCKVAIKINEARQQQKKPQAIIISNVVQVSMLDTVGNTPAQV